MWIAIDPDQPRRRTAFGDEERARSHAGGLTPPWTVLAVDDPRIVPITGTWPEASDER